MDRFTLRPANSLRQRLQDDSDDDEELDLEAEKRKLILERHDSERQEKLTRSESLRGSGSSSTSGISTTTTITTGDRLDTKPQAKEEAPAQPKGAVLGK